MTAERDPWLVLGVRRSAAWSDIRAAYRALARCYHADGTHPDGDRMVEINAAYARLERELSQRREAPVARPAPPASVAAAGPAPAPSPVPVGSGWAGPASPARGSLLGRIAAARHAEVDSPVVDFGQYAGWRIADIAACDPRYLRWLSRHSSGHRFRLAIAQVLGSDPEIGRRAALIG